MTELSAQGQAKPAEQGLAVDASEAGMKLIGFLERHLGLPTGLLHRWIRTGQVRISGSRAKPFDRVASGDQVRVPPFAFDLAKEAAQANAQPKAQRPAHTATSAPASPAHGKPGSERSCKPSPERTARQAAKQASTRPALAKASQAKPQKGKQDRQGTRPGTPALEVLGRTQDGLFAVFKPQGLPTHPGTGHDDALSTRLKALFPESVFPPTPVHRLDRDTSGVLLVASTFEGLRKAQDLFQSHEAVRKEYLCWVRGAWPRKGISILRHWLSKKPVNGKERMVASLTPGDGLEAVLACRALIVRDTESLIHVRIFTGRTHQIRAQLAASGHPILGDGKYGQASGAPMLLHALRLQLPLGSFAALPRWTGRHAVKDMPLPLEADPNL